MDAQKTSTDGARQVRLGAYSATAYTGWLPDKTD